MRHPAFVATFVFGFCILPAAVTGNTTYIIEPVALSDGYAIDSGFVTTTGVTGNLGISEITDYEIVVSGPMPYVFSPSNPFAEVFVEGVLQATSTELFLPIDTDPSDQMSNRFQLRAQENISSSCAVCRQILNYQQFLSDEDDETRYNYINRDFADLDPDGQASLIFAPQQTLVIARVPEPGALVLIGVGLAVLVVCRGR